MSTRRFNESISTSRAFGICMSKRETIDHSVVSRRATNHGRKRFISVFGATYNHNSHAIVERRGISKGRRSMNISSPSWWMNSMQHILCVSECARMSIMSSLWAFFPTFRTWSLSSCESDKETSKEKESSSESEESYEEEESEHSEQESESEEESYNSETDYESEESSEESN